MTIILAISFMLYKHEQKNEEIQQSSLTISTGFISTNSIRKIDQPIYTTTPKPNRSHYISVNKYVTTQYPTRYNVKVFGTWSFIDRLSLLPKQDRTYDHYIVIRRLWMIVPVLTNSNNNKDFFTSSNTSKLLEWWAVMHPFSDTSPLIIGGHTSYYKKKKSNYGTIFQSLALLEADDVIEIYKKNKAWQRWSNNYVVWERSIVTPKEQQQLSGKSSDIILYGCYPFGSINKRIVIKWKKTIN